MSLSFEQVGFQYRGTSIGVHDVSLSLASGELVALIGPSGSGKTTLLRLTAGLISGHSGRIVLDGRDLSGMPVHERHIGMMFQHYALFPHLTVLENVGYGLKMAGVEAGARRKKSQEMLDLVGLGQLAGRRPAQLSGGQQQRVALARALAYSPQALLLDEPLSALDASIRGQLRDQIRQLQQQFGATTLLVTHDQEEALAMADRIALLDQGRVLQYGTPTELYENPLNETVARFVGLSTICTATVCGEGEIDTGYARLRCDTGARAPGEQVKLLVRPEHIEADPPLFAVNRMEGHVTLNRYLGSFNRYDFMPHGAQQPWLGEARSAPADAIAVAPEHIRLLAA
ncbi:ABC transporter ATP-binding protein [Craterilacuibacter sinensis]|uniref:ATP-binding cassette domain-containing protein n=1 Tax=Craterilacuibacter sinensis TaxID=2686017 RepID=A0A845BTU3_9NEIS|nr:ABC transporter ATP-binding protein [Craterilacuibacter sinensis]MXR35963.1 ATP-binding cassette domain-containing protein [Craterilacuibacter sinensis]RQW28251.1 ABC transporter ATP-binding protein [Rhodobacteraceae bacterium CH30]